MHEGLRFGSYSLLILKGFLVPPARMTVTNFCIILCWYRQQNLFFTLGRPVLYSILAGISSQNAVGVVESRFSSHIKFSGPYNMAPFLLHRSTKNFTFIGSFPIATGKSQYSHETNPNPFGLNAHVGTGRTTWKPNQSWKIMNKHL